MLLFLYFSQEKSLSVDYSMLAQLFPDLTAGGLRSLVHLLKQKDLLMVIRKEGRTVVSISPYGRILLEKRLPFLALAVVQADDPISLAASTLPYHCLILRDSVPSDPQFRQLKKVLALYHFLKVQPRVYFLQGELPQELLRLCEEKYFAAVWLFAITDWHLPNNYLFFSKENSYSDVTAILSGISSNVVKLIEKKDGHSDLKHQQKKALFSVFDQIFWLVTDQPLLFSRFSELRLQIFHLLEMLFAAFLL